MPDDKDVSIGLLKSIQKNDRNYDLIQRHCSECNGAHYEVWRTSGASFSRYKLPHKFSYDDFEDFVELLDERLLQTSAELLREFRSKLDEINSPDGIEANESFAFRLAEYARQRALILQKLDMLDTLLAEELPSKPHEQAIRAAFELGMAAAEYQVMNNYEEYMFDGMAMSEWRESGLPKARAERLRQGIQSRNAILGAARALYAKEPALIRNDSETARKILALRLPELQKGNGVQLGFDAITRHLRAARKSDN
jgi:hypothetical protein